MFNVKSPNSDATMMVWCVLLFVWVICFLFAPVHIVSILVKVVSVSIFLVFTIFVVKYVQWEDARYKKRKQETTEKFKNGYRCPFCGGFINDGIWGSASCSKCESIKIFDKWYKE